MRRILAYLPVLGLLTVLLSGCATEEETDNAQFGDSMGVSGGETPGEKAGLFDDNRLVADEVTPEIQADIDKTEPAAGEEVVVFDTSKGEIVVMLYGLVAPKTVDNFKKLVNDGYYDGTRFHRCMPGFMIQGGDPGSADLARSSSWGTGGPGYTIPDELNPIKHVQGVLSMANTGMPNSGGSQFFIMDGVASHLDYVHAAFGRVLSGQDVAQAIIATGANAGRSGMVDPSSAVVIKSVKVATWPLD